MQAVKEEIHTKREEPQFQFQLLQMEFEDLQVIRSHDRVSIFYRGFCFFSYENTDRFSRNYCMVQLHLSGKIKLKKLSEIFGLSYQHCSNAVGLYKGQGIDGLIEQTSKRYQNRQKIDQKIGEMILELRKKGSPYREISQIILFRFRCRIKVQSIRAWAYRRNKTESTKEEEKQVEMFEQETPSRTEEGVWHQNSYAGSMILYAMIERGGFLKPFEEFIEQDEKKKRGSWGTRRVLLTLFFLHALRCKSVEQGKHLVGSDFKEIVGGDFLKLQWLRYAADEIVGEKGFDKSIDAYFKDLIGQTDLKDHVYYTDGHFSSYYGKRKIPKGYDPRRQMGFRGRNTVFLHNTQGQIAYLFESPLNKNLSHDIETLVEDMEKYGMKLKRRTLIFDRGGYSQRCFKFLKKKKKVYFVSFLKNRKNERQVDPEQFKVCVIKAEEGDEEEYRIFEKERRHTSYGMVRVVVLLTSDGKQIPILTNNPYLKAETIIYFLKRRWREENCFKYMIEHFGIDLLTTYKVETAPEHIVKRANPERQKINALIMQKKNELDRLQSELGKRVSESGHQNTETVQKFLEQEAKLGFEIKNIQVDIDSLMRKREMVSTKIEVNLKDECVIIAQKRRLLVNAIKAMNYNAEKWLQDLFKQSHSKRDETLSVIRSLWRQPGQIRNCNRVVQVRLKPLDMGAMRSSLDKVLIKLQENNSLRLPDGRTLEISQTH